jgi:hypothetical protein
MPGKAAGDPMVGARTEAVAIKFSLRRNLQGRKLGPAVRNPGNVGQDRCEGRQPWPLCHLPDGRGRGVAADVRRNPVVDRPAAGTARASMSGVEAGCDR